MNKRFVIMVIVCELVLMSMLLIGGFCATALAEEAMPAKFFSWDDLGTYAGAAALVALVTQLTKELPYIKKIPTQVWSYVLAVLVLIASQVFTGTLSASSAALSLANGVLVSLASNGGYSLITRVKSAAEGQ
ncbi:MAG: hypothetical protein J6M10_10305 [Clostridia bacterium]|nr:hypothetical protein [Clostridia bacterium]